MVLNHADVRTTAAGYPYYHQEPATGASMWADLASRARAASRGSSQGGNGDIGTL